MNCIDSKTIRLLFIVSCFGLSVAEPRPSDVPHLHEILTLMVPVGDAGATYGQSTYNVLLMYLSLETKNDLGRTRSWMATPCSTNAPLFSNPVTRCVPKLVFAPSPGE
ncbi:MAG TPA: hypothetical protein VIG25_17505 [Pyrinomonadaceae bacterium]